MPGIPLLPSYPPGAPPPLLPYIKSCLRLLLTESAYFWLLAGPVILGDAILTQLIIHVIPYTEIDWETYMFQVELYIKGERDYAFIEGPTGPLVYPAGHVFIHRLLYAVTDAGRNIALGQQIYAALYVASVITTCAIYSQAKNIPNWVVILLPLSKRLHSIFVLRLFNDCWAVVSMEAAVLAYGGGWDNLGTILFSAAVSVKMSTLLYFPGLLVILTKRHGLLSTFRHVLAVVLTQGLLASPFILQHPWSYLRRSFDISRVFLYKWTVNWRFVGEETFLSAEWAKALLVGHICALLAFGAFRWCRNEGGVLKTLSRAVRHPSLPAGLAPVTADHVTTILFTSNLIGILFARSLHYQFYAWYAQQLPFLIWRTRYPIIMKMGLLVCVEYAWNIYPSTSLSSGILLVANVMILAGVWWGFPEGKDVQLTPQKETQKIPS